MAPALPTVREFMNPNHLAVSEDDDILDAIRVLIDRGVTGVPVVDARGKLTGILSELECLRLLTKGEKHDSDRPRGSVAEHMDRDVQTVTPDMDIYYVAGLFLSTGYRRFAVVEGEELVGVITRKDVIKVAERELTEE